MAIINLTAGQMKELQAEINKCEKAYRNGKIGMLLFQVWPGAASAEGGFVPHDPSEEILEIMQKYHV